MAWDAYEKSLLFIKFPRPNIIRILNIHDLSALASKINGLSNFLQEMNWVSK